MNRKTILISILIIIIEFSFMACNSNTKGSKSGNNSEKKSAKGFYATITRNSNGDFRSYQLNKTSLNEVKKSETPSALSKETANHLFYQYQIDNYNRYDANFYFDNGILNQIAIDYYSYENDGDAAYKNGKDLYDKLFDDFTKKYGQGKIYANDNMYWYTAKSEDGHQMTVHLANTGKKGSSGTVQLFLKLN